MTRSSRRRHRKNSTSQLLLLQERRPLEDLRRVQAAHGWTAGGEFRRSRRHPREEVREEAQAAQGRFRERPLLRYCRMERQPHHHPRGESRLPEDAGPRVREQRNGGGPRQASVAQGSARTNRRSGEGRHDQAARRKARRQEEAGRRSGGIGFRSRPRVARLPARFEPTLVGSNRSFTRRSMRDGQAEPGAINEAPCGTR